MKLSFIRLIFFVAVLLIGLFVYGIFSSKSEALNVVIISVDTLRPDHMGVFGYIKNTTPNIDKWAKKATIFTNSYTIVPETEQSFYTLFTGSEYFLNNSLKALESVNEANYLTLPQILRANGYKTAAFITNPTFNYFPLFKRGFDKYYSFDGPDHNQIYDTNKYKYQNETQKKVTHDASSWLEGNGRDKFFLWVHYTTPHMPYNPEKKFICAIDEQCNLEKYEPLIAEDTRSSKFLVSCDPNTSAEIIQLEKNLYDAEILSMDHQVGLILDQIKKLNIEDKTLVVFYGDHGEGFDHNIYNHSTALYESSLKIPLIIYNPLRPGPKEAGRLLDNQDILPTLLKLLSINYPESFSGISFASLFDHSINNTYPKNHVFASTRKFDKHSVFDGRYKYIVSNTDPCLDGGQTEELYDIQSDPKELKNLINEKVEIAKNLKAKISSLEELNGNENFDYKKDIIQKLKSIGY